MIPNSMRIAIAEIEDKLDFSKSIEEQLKQAMSLIQRHWLVTDEDTQFRCAVGAVMLHANEDVRTSLKEELSFIRTLSSAVAGVPVDLERALTDVDSEKWFGLVKLWNETKGGQPK